MRTVVQKSREVGFLVGFRPPDFHNKFFIASSICEFSKESK